MHASRGTFWGAGVRYANQIRNRCLAEKKETKTHFERLTGTKPQLKKLRILERNVTTQIMKNT